MKILGMQWKSAVLILSSLLFVVQARKKLIIVGMSGLRHDYINQASLPTLHLFKNSGVHAKQVEIPMITNSWPSLWTVATGLWPEEHGIIDDTMSDPTINGQFIAGVSKVNTLWFPCKPIWISAEESGVKTAVSGWPGSDIMYGSTKATNHHPFVAEESEQQTRSRIEELSSWMLDGADLALFMLPEPDNTAHETGAESDQVREALKKNDRLLSYLLDALEAVGLTERDVDIIIVGDHGMVNHKSEDVIYLSDYGVQMGDLKWLTGSLFTTGMLVPHPGLIDSTYKKLSQNNANNSFTAYLKEHLPDTFHIKNHRRTAPIVLVPKPGYRIEITRPHTDINIPERTRGMHGYDHQLADMKPLMLARGPNFKNITLNSISSTDIYPLVCSLLELDTCHGTDATMEVAQRMVKVPLTDKRPAKIDYASFNTGPRIQIESNDFSSLATSLHFNYCTVLCTLLSTLLSTVAAPRT